MSVDLAHDPEKCVAVSRLREAPDGSIARFDASAGEGRSEKIMRKQRAKARWRFNLIPSRFMRPTIAQGAKVRASAMSSAGWTFRRALSRLLVLAALTIASLASAHAVPCLFDDQGEGHVAEVIDGKSFRLGDGREIRLAGIEPVGATRAERSAALSAILADKDVSLRGGDDAPDRYGRQDAFVFLAGSPISVQGLLLAEGAALVSSEVADRDCAAALSAAEAEARSAKKGTWAGTAVIKNAESADDILTGIGRFVLVEGKVLSVRQAGAVTYLNFGRRWTRDFAATISRRNMTAVESAGIALKSLENRRIRVRGWVEARPGPRIEVTRAGQIEVLGGN
jgi:endonuclease YncB( thermonuclease family)